MDQISAFIGVLSEHRCYIRVSKSGSGDDLYPDSITLVNENHDPFPVTFGGLRYFPLSMPARIFAQLLREHVIELYRRDGYGLEFYRLSLAAKVGGEPV